MMLLPEKGSGQGSLCSPRHRDVFWEESPDPTLIDYAAAFAGAGCCDILTTILCSMEYFSFFLSLHNSGATWALDTSILRRAFGPREFLPRHSTGLLLSA